MTWADILTTQLFANSVGRNMAGVVVYLLLSLLVAS